MWPSLLQVRTTSLPHYSLPSFAAAVEFLHDPVLSLRLSAITRVATGHLRNGVPPEVLFGSGTDAAKFYETVTLFAVAAAVGKRSDVAVHCAAVAAIAPADAALHPETMAAIRTETGVDYGSTVQVFLAWA